MHHLLIIGAGHIKELFVVCVPEVIKRKTASQYGKIARSTSDRNLLQDHSKHFSGGQARKWVCPKEVVLHCFSRG